MIGGKYSIAVLRNFPLCNFHMEHLRRPLMHKYYALRKLHGIGAIV